VGGATAHRYLFGVKPVGTPLSVLFRYSLECESPAAFRVQAGPVIKDALARPAVTNIQFFGYTLDDTFFLSLWESVMVNKKKTLPPAETTRSAKSAKLTLESCQDLREKAMISVDEGHWPGFKSNLIQAIKDAEGLISDSKNGQPGEDSIEDLNEFVASSCFEIGTFLLEEDDEKEEEEEEEKEEKLDEDDTICAKQAMPYLERAIELFKAQSDVSQSFYRTTVVALSEAYDALHMHDNDIQLCSEYLERLTAQYNTSTPLQNEILVALAIALNSVGRMDEAERAYKQIVDVCKINFGDDHEQTEEAEADLLEFLEEKDFGVCHCQLTEQQIEELRQRADELDRLQGIEH
jgi:tetratricopeptide (TPR) repeat protein